jgi:dihydrofolate synthase / folylpolyglutamate synthase
MTQSNVQTRRQEALAFLFGRINYERTQSIPYGQREFRLDRMHGFLARLGNPHEQLKLVHVAGTKGKGSTSAMIAAALSAAGYRTALYTSPHLDRLEERFVVDGQACSATEFVDLIDELRPIVAQMDAEGRDPPEADTAPTYFEILTAVAFLHFARRSVDAAVIEVGLGGRLDSTNVCRPLVSVITSISFDHTEQLGNTLGKIAAEKAGIIKPGVPVVSGVVDDEPRQVIAEIARERNSRLVQLGVDFKFDYTPARGLDGDGPATNGAIDYFNLGASDRWQGKSVELGLVGRHQAANAAVALATVAELRSQGWLLPEVDIRRGLANACLPARVEMVARRPTVVIDAAHNVASIQSLLATLDESFVARRRILVFAPTQDKDVRGMLECLLPRFEQVILTRYSNNPRAMNIAELESLVAEMSPIARCSCPTPAVAVERALQLASPDHLVCITGSFFLAAEARQAFADAINSRRATPSGESPRDSTSLTVSPEGVAPPAISQRA